MIVYRYTQLFKLLVDVVVADERFVGLDVDATHYWFSLRTVPMTAFLRDINTTKPHDLRPVPTLYSSEHELDRQLC
jgi:hypothetical protein